MSQSDEETSEFEVTAYIASDAATSGQIAKALTVEAESKEAANTKVKERNNVESIDPQLTMEVERDENGKRTY